MKETANAIDREVKEIVETAHQQALATIKHNRDLLETITLQLLETGSHRRRGPTSATRPGAGCNCYCVIEVFRSSLMNQDYVGKDLKGQDFSERCLDEVNFRNADLSDANLNKGQPDSCRLERCQFSGGQSQSGNVKSSQPQQCKFSGSHPDRGRIGWSQSV